MAALQVQSFRQNAEAGDVTSLVNLIQNSNFHTDERDENRQSYLMYACQLGSLVVVRELLNKGADVNAVDDDNWSALLNASRGGFADVVIELLEAGATLEHRDMGGWTALVWACYKGRTEVAQALLERGASPNCKGEYRVPAIVWAAGRGHAEIVKMLLRCGAKVNATDKHGTTPLIWAARKGYIQTVEILLAEGANVDTAGMNSWTALLMACRGGFTDCVRAILEHHPNINAVDKDGVTGLAIAAREGYVEIVQDLLEKGAYVNLTDRDGDSILIRAVKGGHVEIVRALLKKSADIDMAGAENKSALYWAVEKNNVEIVKILLRPNPDTEIQAKDGSTALLKAVRNRNVEIVQLLLDRRAKPSATDKRGDNCLHVALKARNKRITELLLRNPKESRLLYRQNSAGETPYNIDTSHQKSIITQIFGARNLNAADASENLLGYDLYSSSLADVLSEPTMHTPMTVGLFAKWGSGKSFLLGKLEEEMKSFSQHCVDIYFEFSWFIFCFVLLLCVIIGLEVGLSWRWEAGVGMGLGLFALLYLLMGFLWFSYTYRDWDWAETVSMYLGQKIASFSLLMKVLFCNQPNEEATMSQAPGIKFLFTETTKLTSVGGEKSIAAMISTLSAAIEHEYGLIPTRLFRACGPTKSSSRRFSRFKGICCVPYFLIVIFILLCIVVGAGLLIRYGVQEENHSVNGVLIALVVIIGFSLIANVYNWAQMILALAQSQKSRIMKAAGDLESLKMEGFLQILKSEITLMVRTVQCIDAFTGNNTRLVVILDGLDSCEQEKVMLVLDMVHNLFCVADTPFITLLAVDPHIIIKGIESNMSQVFHDSSINGHDYLRNIVHLPFYLQSQGLPRPHMESPLHDLPVSPSVKPGPKRQESTWSSVTQIPENKKHRLTKSTTGTSALSFGSNLGGSLLFSSSVSRPPSVMDLSKSVTLRNDYFSDVNPKSMRRLMNIVAITGRLLRAYTIDFNWYRLSAWINLSEQWPYRTSWLLLYYEEQEGQLDDNMTLKEVYDNVIDRIPLSKDIDPLLEIDRNAKKFEAFLTSHVPMLNVGDLRKLLPCTISLDPYLRKLIREMSRQTEQLGLDYNPFNQLYPLDTTSTLPNDLSANSMLRRRMRDAYVSPQTTPLKHYQQGLRAPSMPIMQQYPPHFQQMMMAPRAYGSNPVMPQYFMPPYYPPMNSQMNIRSAPASNATVNFQSEKRLSQMTVEDICNTLLKLQGLDSSRIAEYQKSLKKHNISGQVLNNCDVDELKQVMLMSFGDWQLFCDLVLSLRDQELTLLENDENEDSLAMQDSADVKVLDRQESIIDASHLQGELCNLGQQFDLTDSGPRSRTNSFGQQDIIIPRSRTNSSANKNNPRFFVSRSRQGSITPAEERKSSEKSRMTRKDSMVTQIMMENMLLKDAMNDFTDGQAAIKDAEEELAAAVRDEQTVEFQLHNEDLDTEGSGVFKSDSSTITVNEHRIHGTEISPRENYKEDTEETESDNADVQKQVTFNKNTDELESKYKASTSKEKTTEDQVGVNCIKSALRHKDKKKGVKFESGSDSDSEGSTSISDSQPLLHHSHQGQHKRRSLTSSVEKLHEHVDKITHAIVHFHHSTNSLSNDNITLMTDNDRRQCLHEELDLPSRSGIESLRTTLNRDLHSSEGSEKKSLRIALENGELSSSRQSSVDEKHVNTDAHKKSRFKVTVREDSISGHSSSTSRDSSLTRSPRDVLSIAKSDEFKIDMDKILNND